MKIRFFVAEASFSSRECVVSKQGTKEYFDLSKSDCMYNAKNNNTLNKSEENYLFNNTFFLKYIPVKTISYLLSL